MNTITITEQTYWIVIALFAIGLLVAPTLTLYLLSWEDFGGWKGSSVASAIIVLSGITIALHIVL